MNSRFRKMLRTLLQATDQGRSARTVELFGWLILCEGLVILFSPNIVFALLHIPPLPEQAEGYLRLVGVLVSGLGMLYVVSGRLDDEGFVFASLLDRPLVPPVMVTLWYLGYLPWQLALAFSVQDFASFLWTYSVWRKEGR